MSGDDLKVMWVDRYGKHHDDEEYFPGETAATFRAMEIMAENRANIHRIWLQGRRIDL